MSHLIIHSSINGHGGCFPIWATVNSNEQGGGADVFEIMSSFPSDVRPAVGSLGHKAVLFLIFEGSAILFSLVPPTGVPFSPN